MKKGLFPKVNISNIIIIYNIIIYKCMNFLNENSNLFEMTIHSMTISS